jgi:hypothetical protein
LYGLGQALHSAEQVGAVNAIKILEQIHAQPSSVPAVWHPLGFIDLEVSRASTRFTRIHIWSDLAGEYMRASVRIHKHDWRMRSFVICGSLRNRIYSLTSNDTPTHHVYAIDYNNDVNFLRRTDRVVSARVNRSEFLRRDVWYGLDEGVFHDIEVDRDGTTATLVQGVRQPLFENEVLGELDGPEVYVTARIACDAASVRAAVSLVLDAVADKRAVSL